jgi:hypothetical protein
MNNMFPARRRLTLGGMILLCGLASVMSGYSQTPVTNDPAFYGPYNAVLLADGDGLKRPVEKDDSVLRADSLWSLYGWVRPAEAPKEPGSFAGIGDPEEEFSRYLALNGEHAILWMGKDNSLSGAASFSPGKWHFPAATFNGEEFRLYSDGLQVAGGKLDLGGVSPALQIAPPFF